MRNDIMTVLKQEIQMNPIHFYCDEQYDIATQANLHIFEQLL
jgi:hypothetical protein